MCLCACVRTPARASLCVCACVVPPPCSWTGDYQAYNLCTREAFPGMSRKERAAQFGRVVYYRPGSEKDEALPTPTRMRGIPLVSLPDTDV